MTTRDGRRSRPQSGRRGAGAAPRPAAPRRPAAQPPGGPPAWERALASAWVLPALLLLGAAAWVLAYRQLAHPIDNIDAEEYAAIGRALATGQGFVTPTLPLNGLAYLQGRGFDLSAPWPDITRFPLPSLVMAALFVPLGATPLAAALASGLFYLLAVPPLYRLARQIGGPLVALTATLLYLIHPGTLQAATSGLTESASGCFLITSLWLLRRGGRWSAPLAGALLGLAFWNRQTLALFALPLAAWLWLRHRPPARRAEAPPAGSAAAAFTPVGLYLGAALLVALPWLTRNLLLTGDPTFNLQNATVIPFGTSAASPDFPWYVPEYTSPATFILAHPGEVVAKWVTQARDLPEVIFNALGPPYLFLLLLSSALLPYPAEVRALRWAALGCLAVHAAAYSLVGNIERFYSFFLPIAVIFAADALDRWSARLGWRWRPLRPALAAGLVLAVGWSMFAQPLGLPTPKTEGAITGQLGSIVDISLANEPYLREHTPADALFATNLPWSVGWQGQRRAIPLPPTPEALPDLAARFSLTLDYLYLNPQVFIVGVPPGWQAWDRIRDGKAEPPAGYVVEQRFGDGSLLLRRAAP